MGADLQTTARLVEFFARKWLISVSLTALAFNFKLNGCGTHMEQIVSVHDLFRPSSGRLQRGKRTMLTRKQAELLRFIHERLKEAACRPPSTR